MLAVERRAFIKEAVLEKKSVIVSELSRQFEVTEETIRRDLKVLEAEGVLTRTYGGAFVQDGVINDVDVSLRETVYVENKRQIAAQCLPLVRNGDSVFLDCSTTALEIAKALRGMRLTVLTNSMLVANCLAEAEQIRLIVIGGVFQPQNRCFLGDAALEALTPYYVDAAFISCRSLSLEHGVTDSGEESAAVRRKITEQADRVYLAADHTKFGKTSFVKICGFQALTGIVSDQPLPPEWHQMARKYHLTLLENKGT